MSGIGISEKQQNIVINILKQYPAVSEVAVYGSRAKGNYTDRSDLDLVIKNELEDRHIIGRIIMDINDSDFPYLVDLQSYASIQNKELLDHIERVGKIFYMKENNTGWTWNPSLKTTVSHSDPTALTSPRLIKYLPYPYEPARIPSKRTFESL